MLRDDRERTGLPFSTDEFFQAVADEFADVLPENLPQLRTKPRVSSLMSDARVIAYNMANIPKSNPARVDPDHVDAAYTAETGRLVEQLNHAGLVRLGRKHNFTVLETPLCIGHEACRNKTAEGAKVNHWAAGHPDDRVILDDGSVVLVSYKHWGRFAYKELTLGGVHERRDKRGKYAKGAELQAQEAAYGAGLVEPPSAIWWLVLAQDASGTRMEFRQKQFEGKNPNPKGYFRKVDWEDMTHLVPALRKRAKWFSKWYAEDGDPSHVAWETPIPENWRDLPSMEVFPWGYTEMEDRALADGPGYLIAPRPLPF